MEFVVLVVMMNIPFQNIEIPKLDMKIQMMKIMMKIIEMMGYMIMLMM